MFVIFVLLLAATFSMCYVRRSAAPVPAGRIATVSVDGKVVDTLYIDELKEPFNRVYEIGEGFNTVYADSEGAAVIEADCRDRYCTRTGKISRPGSSSVCLPHRFVLRIIGWKQDELDGGTY